jgi:hypothetical protein
MFAAFLFAKTGHVIAAIASHAFCNSQGVPDLNWIAEKGTPKRKQGTLASQCSAFEALTPNHSDTCGVFSRDRLLHRLVLHTDLRGMVNSLV